MASHPLVCCCSWTSGKADTIYPMDILATTSYHLNGRHVAVRASRSRTVETVSGLVLERRMNEKRGRPMTLDADMGDGLFYSDEHALKGRPLQSQPSCPRL